MEAIMCDAAVHSECKTLLSVDVEDYFMSPETISVGEWERYECRIEIGSFHLLDLLREYQAQTTWFFLGWVAERYPNLVRRVADDGHEIGVHGYDHRFVSTLSQQEFELSLERSLEALHAAVPNLAVRGHRAPGFSLRRNVPWHWSVLERFGFRYDSSLMPFATYLYGESGLPFTPYTIGSLVEFPPAAMPVMGRAWPVGGGGILRILPDWYLELARERYRTLFGLPPVIHIHPWELDPHPPKLHLPFKQQVIHNLGLRTVERKLRILLSEGTCSPMGRLYGSTVQFLNK